MNIRVFQYAAVSTIALALLLGLGQLIRPAQAADAIPAGEAGQTAWSPNGYRAYNRPAGAGDEIPAAPAAAVICTPDTGGMVAWWQMDEGAGASTFEDVIANPVNNNAACDAGLGLCPASTSPGVVGNAFTFDGVDDEVDVADYTGLQWENTGSFSIELWFKTTQDCTPLTEKDDEKDLRNKVFVGKFKSAIPFPGDYWIGCSGEYLGQSVLAFHLRDTEGKTNGRLLGETPINDGEWHHAVAVHTYTAGETPTYTNTIYLDGAQERSETFAYTGSFISDQPFTIGYMDDQYYFAGQLDEIAIYERALTPAEIQAHYNQGAGQSYCDAGPPVANPDSYSVDEDTTLNVANPAQGVLGNDVNPDFGALTAIKLSDPSHGALTLNADGAFVYTPAANYFGPDSFTYKANDGSADSNTATVSITVNAVSDPPTVTTPPNQEDAEGETITPLQIQASDIEGHTLTYNASGLPGGLSINTATGLISGALTYTSAGVHTVQVTVTDSTGRSTIVSFTWTVTNVNRPPTIVAPANQTNEEWDVIAGLQVQASDPDGDALNYSATGLPNYLSIDSSSGLIHGTLALGSEGVYTVVVSVSDGPGGLTANASFTWTVQARSQFITYLPLILKGGE